MKKELIDYSALVDNAMHLIVKKSLEIFAKNSVDSDHHFFISFITKYPGVVISEKLHNKYPYEMTIVLQYQFEDLIVNDEEFSVSLSFDNQREKIKIPFAALTAFADPSVKFGLQFRHIDEEQMEDDYKTTLNSFSTDGSSSNLKDKIASPKKAKTEGNVISLDFKNKKLQ
ncbi:MAG: ClpXP protease specificity-enhancing factor SspB [Rickettsiales bacterium]